MIICRNAEEVHGKRKVGKLCFRAYISTPLGFQPGIATAEGSLTILEGSRVYILCTELYYICFIRVLDGVVRLRWVAQWGAVQKG